MNKSYRITEIFKVFTHSARERLALSGVLDIPSTDILNFSLSGDGIQEIHSRIQAGRHKGLAQIAYVRGHTIIGWVTPRNGNITFETVTKTTNFQKFMEICTAAQVNANRVVIMFSRGKKSGTINDGSAQYFFEEISKTASKKSEKT